MIPSGVLGEIRTKFREYSKKKPLKESRKKYAGKSLEYYGKKFLKKTLEQSRNQCVDE